MFCYSQVKSLLRERLSGKASAGSNGKTSGGSSEKSEPSASVELIHITSMNSLSKARTFGLWNSLRHGMKLAVHVLFVI